MFEWAAAVHPCDAVQMFSPSLKEVAATPSAAVHGRVRNHLRWSCILHHSGIAPQSQLLHIHWRVQHRHRHHWTSWTLDLDEFGPLHFEVDNQAVGFRHKIVIEFQKIPHQRRENQIKGLQMCGPVHELLAIFLMNPYDSMLAGRGPPAEFQDSNVSRVQPLLHMSPNS